MTIKAQIGDDVSQDAIDRLMYEGCSDVKVWTTPTGNITMRIEWNGKQRVRIAVPQSFDSVEAAVNSLVSEMLAQIKDWRAE